MNDDDFWKNLKMSTIEELREALFRKLLFEPFTDQDFHAPVAKLKELVAGTTEMCDRAESQIRDIKGLTLRISHFGVECKITESFKENYARYDDTPMADYKARGEAAIADYANSIIALAASEAGRARLEVTSAARLAKARCPDFDVALQGLLIEAGMAHLELLSLKLLLLRMAAAITEDTKEVFHVALMPKVIDDLSKELAGAFAHESHMPAVMPGYTLFRLFLDYIRRKQDVEEEQETTWKKMKSSVILSLYLDWWSDGGGKQSVDSSQQAVLGKTNSLDEALTVQRGLLNEAFRQHENFVRVVQRAQDVQSNDEATQANN